MNLLLIDEAARVDDDMVAAAKPMLATVSDSALVCLSTPFSRSGFFFQWWEHGGPVWERTKITAEQCDRISPEFLAEELRTLGPNIYSREYQCEFMDDEAACFAMKIIERAFDPELQPLWQ